MPPAVNSKTGMIYNTIPAAGGVWHVYSDGRKVFVRSSAGAAPEAAPAAPGTSPEESAYWTGQQQISDGTQAQQAAQALFEKTQGLQANDRSAQTNSENYQEALRQMSIAQPKDEQNARVGANKQGLFYSTTLGNQLGDIASSYVDKKTAAEKEFSRAEAERVASRQSIEAGYGTQGQAQAEAGVGRFLQQDTDSADNGGLVAPAAPTGGVATTPMRTPAAQPFKTVVKRGNVYHYTPGKAPVYVRKATH